MKTKKLLMTCIAAAALLSPLAFAKPAYADYCREFQKTIRIGGRLESGYGTACQQPDGSWMIVSTQGQVDPFDQLRAQNVSIVAEQQPVYYVYGPRYRPVTYYAPVRYYQPAPVISFGFFSGRNWHDNGWHRGWDHDGWDHRGGWDHH